MSGMQFEGQREGEKLELVFRKHILTARRGILWLMICVVLGIVPKMLWPEEEMTVLVLAGMAMIGIFGLMFAMMTWYFSMYILTNQRLRQVMQKGLFNKTILDLDFEKIENISYETKGIMGGIFGWGTILIQTSAGEMRLSKIKQAEKVYNKMQNVVGKAIR